MQKNYKYTRPPNISMLGMSYWDGIYPEMLKLPCLPVSPQTMCKLG